MLLSLFMLIPFFILVAIFGSDLAIAIFFGTIFLFGTIGAFWLTKKLLKKYHQRKK